jgi:hypothetical protein
MKNLAPLQRRLACISDDSYRTSLRLTFSLSARLERGLPGQLVVLPLAG